MSLTIDHVRGTKSTRGECALPAERICDGAQLPLTQPRAFL
jgi:hypothetical protein